MEPKIGLKTLRAELGITQSELAAALHVSFSAVNRWENGKNFPAKSAVMAITNYAQEKGASESCLRQLADDWSQNRQKLVEKEFAIPPELLVQLADESQTAIYVADYETDRLLFLNSTAKKILHADGELNGGQKCYEYLMHRNSPCSFCHKQQLQTDTFLEGSLLYPFDCRDYKINSKILSWGGRKVHVHFITDVTDLLWKEKTVEQQMQQEQEKYASTDRLLNEVPCGIGIYGIDGGRATLLYLNDAYYKMLGFCRNQRMQFSGAGHENVIYPADKPMVDGMILRLIEGADEGSVQHRIQNGRGEWIWIHLAATVVERSGSRLKVYVSFTDCDELIRSGKRMADTQAKMEALLAGIPGGVAMYRLKKDGRIPTDYVSDGLARVCGYDDGADFLTVIGEDSRKLVFPEDYPVIAAACKNSLETGAPTSVNYRVYGKDGSPVRLTLDSVVMKDAALGPEDVAVFYAVQTPVSQEMVRSKMEQDYYRAILNITGTAFFEVDDNGKFYASDTFSRYRLSEGGIRAIRDAELGRVCIHPEDFEKIRQYLTKISRKNDSSPVVARMLMTDGSYQWTEITGHVEFDNNHRLRRVTGILRNINPEWEKQKAELEAALEEARKANQAKTAFLSRVSHDMRTPLNGILGLTELLRDNITDEGNLSDLRELEMSGKYLLNLINDTLDMSRIESGRLELHPVVCDGRSFFQTTLGLAKTAVSSKQLQYRVHADELPDTVLYADIARTEQVIMNVVSNAVKFTPEGGTVELTLRTLSADDGVITEQVIVRDTGIGMSPEFLPHLFEAFSQEDATKTSAAQGTGLGMAITRQLLSLMNGDISVASEAGKGSCFTMTLKLPIASAEQVEAWNREQREAKLGRDLSGKRVLLCEDHPLNAKITTRLLAAQGVLVEHAENGQIGLEKFSGSREGYYDGILMDIRMPVMDGIAAARAIRALARADARTVPIIAITANAFSDDVEETKAAGMNAHLSKPIKTEELLRMLESLLAPEPPETRKHRRKKILVVDDATVNRAVLRTALEEEYDILEAKNGEDALAVIGGTRGLDAVITDLEMPVMDGRELIRRIRSSPEGRRLAIIACTQYGSPEQEEKLLALGANDFIYKPTTPRIVEMRVQNALRKQF